MFYFNSFACFPNFSSVLSNLFIAEEIALRGSVPSVSRINCASLMSGCSTAYVASLTLSSCKSSCFSALQSVCPSPTILNTNLFFFSSTILSSMVVFYGGLFIYLWLFWLVIL